MSNEEYSPSNEFPTALQEDGGLNDSIYAHVSRSIYGDPNISHAECRVYQLISGFCGSSGRCTATDDHLHEIFPVMNRKNFSKHTKALEEKGVLLRINKRMSKKGSRRILVTKCHYTRFKEWCKKKGYYKDLALCDEYFECRDYQDSVKFWKEKLSKNDTSPRHNNSQNTDHVPIIKTSNDFLTTETSLIETISRENISNIEKSENTNSTPPKHPVSIVARELATSFLQSIQSFKEDFLCRNINR